MRSLLILLGCVALASCHSHAGHDHAGHDHAAEGHDHAAESGRHVEAVESHGHEHAGEIVLPAEKARAAGIVVEPVEPAPFREVIAASGRILAAQGDERSIVAPVSGVVTFPRTVVEGMAVGEGTPLLTLSARHLQDGDPAERARIAYERARAEYERAAKLVGDQIVSQRDFEAIRADYETACIAWEAFSQEGGGEGTVVRSPLGGFVKSCAVREGDYVTTGQPLMTLTRNRRLQLRADVSERHYSQLGSIVSANLRLPSGEVMRLDELGGRLLAYGRSADENSAYIPVTFSFDNRGSVLPGAFAEVWLLGAERQGVITLPLTALTEEQGVYFIYIRLDEDCYRKQEVEVGASDGERIEILSGLHGGEHVVTKGAVHVRLASASNAIPAHTHNH